MQRSLIEASARILSAQSFEVRYGNLEQKDARLEFPLMELPQPPTVKQEIILSILLRSAMPDVTIQIEVSHYSQPPFRIDATSGPANT
jgi:hypothetical protein